MAVACASLVLPRPPPLPPGHSRITIDYNVIAICKQDGLLKSPIQHKAPLTVHQVSATPEDAGPLSAESRRDITSCMCMRQGEIAMTIDCSTNYARPNDVLTVRIKVGCFFGRGAALYRAVTRSGE